MGKILYIGGENHTLDIVQRVFAFGSYPWEAVSVDTLEADCQPLVGSQADFIVFEKEDCEELLGRMLDARPGRTASRDEMERRLTRSLESRARLVWQLGRLVEGRDEFGGNHVVRVGFFSRAIAESMGLDSQFVETLFLAAPLHDVGNSRIPDVILLKRESLTPREYEIVKQHCVVGARILREQANVGTSLLSGMGLLAETDDEGGDPILEMAASIALTHHEKWDGTGYPQGLVGEGIPLESRIVAIADVFDSLTSQRPHREPYPFDAAVEIVRNGAGRHFDPDVYTAFAAVLDQIRTISESLVDLDLGAGAEDILWDDDQWLTEEPSLAE